MYANLSIAKQILGLQNRGMGLNRRNRYRGAGKMRISDGISLLSFVTCTWLKKQEKVAMKDDGLACGSSRCMRDIVYTVQSYSF